MKSLSSTFFRNFSRISLNLSFRQQCHISVSRIVQTKVYFFNPKTLYKVGTHVAGFSETLITVSSFPEHVNRRAGVDAIIISGYQCCYLRVELNIFSLLCRGRVFTHNRVRFLHVVIAYRQDSVSVNNHGPYFERALSVLGSFFSNSKETLSHCIPVIGVSFGNFNYSLVQLYYFFPPIIRPKRPINIRTLAPGSGTILLENTI